MDTQEKIKALRKMILASGDSMKIPTPIECVYLMSYADPIFGDENTMYIPYTADYVDAYEKYDDKLELILYGKKGYGVATTSMFENKDEIIDKLYEQLSGKPMTYYAFMPFFHWRECCDKRPENNKNLHGDYILAHITKTTDGAYAHHLYAEVPCPASQLVQANSPEELEKKIDEMIKNFENPEWVSELEETL